jgi:hypothetical protein
LLIVLIIIIIIIIILILNTVIIKHVSVFVFRMTKADRNKVLTIHSFLKNVYITEQV